MDVVSVCPLRVGSLPWQPRAGTWALTIACKATYRLLPGESALAADQDGLNERDNHWNDDPARSIHAPSDLAPHKPRAEVVAVGYAFAPHGDPVKSLTARLVVGPIDKSIELWGERSFGPDGKLQHGIGFTRIPLLWERAAGGPGTSNPVGVPRAPDLSGKVLLPNLCQPGVRLMRPQDYLEPVGFGPIAPSWPERSARLGKHAGSWTPERLSADPLPDDFDAGFFNCAPADQQLDALRDNETIALEHLHVDHALLVTRLPGVRPRAFVERPSAAPQELALHADTLWIDTDRGLCTLTWRGIIGISAPVERGRVLVGLEAGGSRLSYAELERSARLHDDSTDDSTIAPDPVGGALGLGALPFRGNAPTPPPAPPSRPALQLDGESTGLVMTSALKLQARQRAAGPDLSPAWLASPRTATAPPAVVQRADEGAAAESAPIPGSGTPAPGSSPQRLPSEAIGTPVSARPPEPVPPTSAAQASVPPAVAGPAPASPLALQPQKPSPAIDSPWAGGAMRAQAGYAVPVSAPIDRPAPPPVVTAVAPAEALQLLWVDEALSPRLRRRPEWKRILDQLEEAPPEAGRDDLALGEDPAAVEDRREVFEVMARATPLAESALAQAVTGATGKDGRFVPQLVLVAGEARFDFDELELLKATMAAAKPVAGTDAELKTSLDDAATFTAMPDLVASPEVIGGFTLRIREAFGRAPRGLGPSYLDDQIERVLLDRRAYQKRQVFGAPHLRGLFFSTGSTTGVPAYFAEPMAKELPLFRRLRVRLIVEAHHQIDQYEPHPHALRVAALVRVLPR